MRAAIRKYPSMMSAPESALPTTYSLPFERALEDVERVLRAHATVGGDLRNALGLGKEHGVARDVADRRKRRRLGEVQPLEIRPAVGAADRAARAGRCRTSRSGTRGSRPTRTCTMPPSSIAGNLPRRRVLLERVPRRLECDGRELVRNAELLQQPDDANRAGELRVVELDHRRASDGWLSSAVLCAAPVGSRWRFSATATCSVGAGGGGIVGVGVWG